MINVVVSPGSKLLIPAHWYFAVRAQMNPISPEDDNNDELPVSLGLVGYIHSPVSRLAAALNGTP